MKTLPGPIGHTSLNEHLRSHAKVPDSLRHLVLDIAKGAKYIHHALRTTEAGLSGSVNQFGEKQMAVDVLADEILCQVLTESASVNSFISEERDEIVELAPKAPYAVVFDPLDGSSLIDANFAIGSIFGIYATGELIGRTPREQSAALYVLYGPRTVLVYGAGNGVHSFVLNEVGEFTLLRENLGIADDAKNFSPGNLSAMAENEGYARAFSRWQDTPLTLRYSGCMVADVHHILAKGQGVFTNVGGAKYPNGKLRFVFECGPMAYLIEQAGGASSDGKQSLLDKRIEAIDQRSQIIVGSMNEVAATVKLLHA